MFQSDPPPLPDVDAAQWLDLLAGRPAPGTSPRARAQALALRSALHCIDARSAAVTSDPAAHLTALQAEGRLLARLRTEGLLCAVQPPQTRRDPPCRAWSAWPWSWAGGWPAWSGLAATAALAAWLVLRPPLVPVPGGFDDEPPVLRGQLAPLTLQRPDPQAFSLGLQAELATAGAALRPYRTPQAWVLDIDVAAEQLEAATPVLLAAGVPPQAGLTRVIVRKAAATPAR